LALVFCGGHANQNAIRAACMSGMHLLGFGNRQ